MLRILTLFDREDVIPSELPGNWEVHWGRDFPDKDPTTNNDNVNFVHSDENHDEPEESPSTSSFLLEHTVNTTFAPTAHPVSPSEFFIRDASSPWRPTPSSSSSPSSSSGGRNHSSQSSMDPQNQAIVAVLMTLIVVLCVILGMVTLPPVWNYFKRKIPISLARIERRYATIDSWMIQKKVQPHDEVCDCLRRKFGGKQEAVEQAERNTNTNTNRTCSYDATCIIQKLAPAREDDNHDDDDINNNLGDLELNKTDSGDTGETRAMGDASDDSDVELGRESAPAGGGMEDTMSLSGVCMEEKSTCSSLLSNQEEKHGCSICLEAFRVNDIVSWSTDVTCGHVFHHACIREWLLRRMACPCCRQVLLPVDRCLVTRWSRPQRRSQREDGSQGTGDSTLESPTLWNRMSQTFSQQGTDSSQRGRHGGRQLLPRRLTHSMLQAFARERARRTTQSYFCIQEGLVSLPELKLLPSAIQPTPWTLRKNRERKSHIPKKNGSAESPGRHLAWFPWPPTAPRRLDTATSSSPDDTMLVEDVEELKITPSPVSSSTCVNGHEVHGENYESGMNLPSSDQRKEEDDYALDTRSSTIEIHFGSESDDDDDDNEGYEIPTIAYSFWSGSWFSRSHEETEDGENVGDEDVIILPASSAEELVAELSSILAVY